MLLFAPPTIVQDWFLPAILTALLYGGQSVYLKGVLPKADTLVVAWAIFAFAVPVYVGFLGVVGLPAVDVSFWPAVLVSLAVNLITWPLFVRAIQISDISLVVPLVAFTPVFILGVEFVLLGEAPAGTGLGGILLIVVGAYVLNIEWGAFGPFDPIRSLANDRGAVYMLIVAAMWSVSATVEKIAVDASSPAFYLTWLSVGFAVLFIPFLAWRADKPLSSVRKHWLALVGVGLLTGAMLVIQMYAVDRTPLVNYVIAIKRAGMLVSVALGWLLFDEENIGFRAIGAVLMIGGVVLIRLA